MQDLATFSNSQIAVLDNATALAEELASDAYKLSISQWLRRKYDIKTLVDLAPDEIVHGPYAQIIRYQGQHKETSLGSAAYDFYKICLQDHSILAALEANRNMQLYPFLLYILIHELVHIVRFSKFLQSFHASAEEKFAEERRVHRKTQEILSKVSIRGIPQVFEFYDKWDVSLETPDR